MEITNVLQQLADHESNAFHTIAQFNNHTFGAADITGTSPVWEMHPDTDEFFYILAGEFQITLLEENGKTTYTAQAGSTFIVPKNIWHKPAAPNGVKFIHHTPGESLHSENPTHLQPA